MAHIDLSGCGTALITPFRNGDVDYVAFASLLDRQVRAGIDFLVPLGTTGETPCLEEDEKFRILELAREHSAGLPVLVGAGTNSLRHTQRNLKSMESCGADAFLIVVPYYNKPTREGQFRYFTELAGSSSKPIVLYNVPGRTGVNMTAETTLRLAEHENIIGVKEASGNKEQIEEILRNAPEGFQVLSGNDDDTLWMMEAGAAGVISVASNIAPELMADLIKAVRTGDLLGSHALNERLAPLFRNCFVESNPIPAKAAMAAMGLIANELRLPLVPSTDATYSLLEETVRDLGLI